jgi:hypothetical protein
MIDCVLINAMQQVDYTVDVTPSLTFERWLQPWHDQHAAGELRHEVASLAPPSRDGRYAVIGIIEPWDTFSNSHINANSTIGLCLAAPCSSHWTSYVAEAQRLIYNERQLENFYSFTLVNRVNIALEASTTSYGQPAITIVVCLGAFESWGNDHHPDGSAIKPDWLILEGDYRNDDGKFLTPGQLVDEGKVIAVGETKLSRDANGHTLDNIVPGTLSCDVSYFAQLQQYGLMTKTRFGFIITETEVVVVQFLREIEATPRKPDELGLRTGELREQSLPLEEDMPRGSSMNHDDYGESTEPSLPTLPTPTGNRKRPRADTSREVSDAAATSPFRHIAKQNAAEPSGTRPEPALSSTVARPASLNDSSQEISSPPAATSSSAMPSSPPAAINTAKSSSS